MAQSTKDPNDELSRQWEAALAEAGASRGAGAESPPIEDQDTGDGGGGSRVLSQDEVDGFLGFQFDEAAISGQSGIRALVDSAMISYERLPMLEIVFERLVRLLTTSLRNFFSDNVEVTIDEITSVRFGDYVSSIPLPTVLAVFKADPWDNSGIITLDSKLIYAVIDVLLGGRRGNSSSRPDGRPYTTIEVNLVRRMIDVVLKDAELAFNPLSPVSFAVDRIETNPRFASITRPANAAILIKLSVDMEERGGEVQILLPYATIEPIRELLLQSFMGEKFGRDPTWEGHLATEIWQTSVELSAVLHETQMPLRQIMALKVGDTLMFEMKPDSLVRMRCGDVLLSEGRVGRTGDNIAVQVLTPLRRSRTTLAVLENNSRPAKE